MGKPKHGFPNKDAFCRMNYLYQAAHTLLRESPQNIELVRHYTHILQSIAKKQVLRIHPEIKRQLCKKCCMLLVPGVTCTVRKKGKTQKHIVVTCLDCTSVKRFPTRANYQLWVDQAESLVESTKSEGKSSSSVKQE